ncbi:dienelactone hydrolase family protein [Streptomyces monticola]|uniref:Dienelactone hydrolase family protein n=1 Tax=Streptomyces monticola TaxID=2666263 RepID=A0ABW2JW05_9ACTN
MLCETVTVTGGEAPLTGELAVPEPALGAVVFAHGSGSSRHSPGNRTVSDALYEQGVGTLLVDLLTEEEAAADEVTREHRFDVGLLAARLTMAVDWLAARSPGLPLGLFGASTGAAAALVAAAKRPHLVRSVVCRGGRPDLAGADALAAVRVPVLLLVGALDEQVLDLNRRAAAELGGLTRLRLVPGAGHLFAEPGALAEVAGVTRRWFAYMWQREKE